MSKYDKDVQDVYAVKQLGDSIGYGHLMALAHELWARHLESKGLPRTGAHCAVGYPMVKEQYQAEALNDRIYTIVVGKALADRKDENSSEKPNNCEDEPTWEQVKEYCHKRCLDIVDSALRKKWYKDEPQPCSFSDCGNFKNPDYERCIECKRKQIKLKTEQAEWSSE